MAKRIKLQRFIKYNIVEHIGMKIGLCVDILIYLITVSQFFVVQKNYQSVVCTLFVGQ